MFIKLPKNRFLTFTFDDGLLAGASKIDRLLAPHKATFYIVTGWVAPNRVPVADEYNLGHDHGRLEDWQALADSGHDIGSHSVSHTGAGEPEFQESLEFLKKIHNGPYSLAFPHNEPRPVVADYQTIRAGAGKEISNRLSDVDLKAVISWSPWPRSLPLWRILWKIGRLREGSWLVLNLHSVDGEGWHPWKSGELVRLKDYAETRGFAIKTMAGMHGLISNFKQHGKS